MATNKRERELAARFYLNNLNAGQEDWVEDSKDPHRDIDPDIIALANLLAQYRQEIKKGL
jgi:hypothetical protein